jgi:hypothetical protein
VTWTGSVDNINAVQSQAAGLGADQRFIWPAVPRVNVDAAATSVDVFTQTPGRSRPRPVRISKDIPAAAVFDSTALGKLYTSPVALARFEADRGLGRPAPAGPTKRRSGRVSERSTIPSAGPVAGDFRPKKRYYADSRDLARRGNPLLRRTGS